MKTKWLVLIIGLLAFSAGYGYSVVRGNAPAVHATQITKVATNHMPSGDALLLANKGDIFKVENDALTQITQGQHFSSPVLFSQKIVAVENGDNYSSLDLLDDAGTKVKTLLQGKGKNIDANHWAGDPAIDSSSSKLAYVSDKNRDTTGVPDNALFIEDLTTGVAKLAASPDPHTGGLANPAFDPADPTQIAYTSYAYDDSSKPYSVVKLLDLMTKKAVDLTTHDQNAYQLSFSPDGTHVVFISRSSDLLSSSLMTADFADGELTNVQTLGTGDYAFPRFSNDNQHIYFLQAKSNTGYDLYIGQAVNGKLSHVDALTNSSALDSEAFEVVPAS